MIHYHGGPMSCNATMASFWATRHACISFAKTYPITIAAEVCQSFILDNGAFTTWRQNKHYDFDGYCAWVDKWCRHPAFDFCLIPDSIEGGELENAELLCAFRSTGLLRYGIPVWHFHESLERLAYLVRNFERIALGSSAEYSRIGTEGWWRRMIEIMSIVCDSRGRPRARIHGLRMLDAKIFSKIPLSSADSTHIARSLAYDIRWTGAYVPITDPARAFVMANRVEHAAAASIWDPKCLIE